jgi:hypothetical protein
VIKRKSDKNKLMQEDYDAELAARFTAVAENENATIKELWLLPEEYFFNWRRRFDYPKLIASFNATKPNFVRWKNEYGLTDDEIISYEISAFLRHADIKRSQKKLYYMEQTFDGKVRRIVAHGDLSKSKKLMVKDHGESYKLLKTFVSYADWCNKENLTFDLFNITSRQAPNHPLEKVWLDTGYELLKLGGIKPPVNGFNVLLRGKHFEYSNLCGLDLTGEMYFGMEGNLEFSYCAIDSMKCNNLILFNAIFFFNCSIKNLKCNNSELTNWHLWLCQLDGDFINSKLRYFEILGGSFTPYVKDCQFIEVQADQSEYINSSYDYTYSLLKKIYNDQGDDSLAATYYIKEREVARQNSRWFTYVFKSISYYYWGYGKRPQNVVYFATLIITLCAFLYYIFPNNIISTSCSHSLLDMFYFSTVTFTTLGYGDITPVGWIRIISLLEAFSGALTIGFLVAGFSRSKY